MINRLKIFVTDEFNLIVQGFELMGSGDASKKRFLLSWVDVAAFLLCCGSVYISLAAFYYNWTHPNLTQMQVLQHFTD